MKTKILEYREYDKQGNLEEPIEYFIKYKKNSWSRWKNVNWYKTIPVDGYNRIHYLTMFKTIEEAQKYIDDVLIKNNNSLIAKRVVKTN